MVSVSKLSQIANAPSPPALTDKLVGVGGGATDYQYTLAQVQSTIGSGTGTITEGTTPTSGFTDGYALISSGNLVGETPIRTILTGNLSLYFDPVLGSDLYNGLSRTYTGGVNGPTNTAQAAISIAANNYDFANLYGVNISQVTAGTLSDTDFIFCPTLVGMSSAQYAGITSSPQYAQIFGDIGTPDTCPCAACFYMGNGAQWDIEGFQATGSYAAFATQPACLATINAIDFAGTFSAGAIAGDGGSVNGFGGEFSISSNMPNWINANFGVVAPTTLDFNEASIAFNNNPVFSDAVIRLQNSYYQMIDGGFTNASTVTGTKAILEDFSALDLQTANADGAPLTRANFPGNSPMEFPIGQSTVTTTPVGSIATTSCLFSDLQQSNSEQIGLQQLISDCTTATIGAPAAGGGNILAWVFNNASQWIVLAASPVFAPFLNSDATGQAGYSNRQFFTVEYGSVGNVMVTFKAGPNGWATSHCSIALLGKATAPNTQNAPFELKFGGASGFSLPPHASITSDNLPFGFAANDTLCIIMDDAAATVDPGDPGSVASSTLSAGLWSKASTASYNQATVSGFSETSSSAILGVALVTTNTNAPISLSGTSLDPAHSSSYLTISNNNLTATAISYPGGDIVSRGTTSYSTGKFYAEFSFSGGFSYLFAGVLNASNSLTLNGAGACGYYNGGGVYVGGSVVTTIASWTTPALIRMATDLVNNRIWFAVGAGNWNNSGSANPATNTGGIDISSINSATTIFAAVECDGGSATVNFGNSTYAYAPPSGFGNW